MEKRGMGTWTGKQRWMRKNVARRAGLALAAALACGAACVDVPQDPLPEEMEFDPTTGRIPQPTQLLVNPETGLLDLSLAGIEVPADCQEQETMSVAQCEFYQYMETLDGFPTLTPAVAPVSAPLDMATVTLPTNLFVADTTKLGILDSSSVTPTFDASTNQLVVLPSEGWEVGRLYLLAVRGYENGVRAASGAEVVAAPVFYFLRQDESLTCGAVTPDAISEDCKFLQLLAEQTGDEASAREQLLELEQVRQAMLASGMWDALDVLAGMPKDEVAVAWAFPTHTASVAELQPAMGIVPEFRSEREIFLSVKGTVDASSVSPLSFGNLDGTVIFLNLTQLAAGNLGGGLPAFDVHVEDRPSGLLLVADEPLTEGDTYGILLTDGLKNEDGLPFVPSPVTVFLRSRGELVDSDGHSTVAELDDETAAQLEEGRQQLATLLDDEQFQQLTGLERENIVYLYAFVYQAQ